MLRNLGEIRRKNLDEPEEHTMMRVLRDMNLSKLVDQDEPLFLSLLRDIFPDDTVEKESESDLLSVTVENQTVKASLIPYRPWLIKILNVSFCSTCELIRLNTRSHCFSVCNCLQSSGSQLLVSRCAGDRWYKARGRRFETPLYY